MLIRWIIGGNLKKSIVEDSYHMLKMSILFMNRLIPNARKVVMISYLKDDGSHLREVLDGIDVEIEYIRDHYSDEPRAIRDFTSWNAFAKAIPRRLDISVPELRLDNDVILWDMPTALQKWIDNPDSLLCLGCSSEYPCDHTPRNEKHGGLLANVSRKLYDPELHINSGIVGYPPGFMPLALPSVASWQQSEQGWTHLNYATFNGKRFMIPFHEVPLLGFNHWAVLPKDKVLTRDYKGAHFIGHNFGDSTQYSDLYKSEVEKELARLEIS